MNISIQKSIYKDQNQTWEIIHGVVERINKDEEAKLKIPKENMIIVYNFPDIDFWYSLIIEGGVFKVCRERLEEADVILKMNSDVYHDIMIGKISPMKTVAEKRSEVIGPLFKLIRIQQLLAPLNRIYKEIAREKGIIL